MSRNARQLSSTDTYHVVIRGADHQLLFEEKKDYQKYLEILQLYEAECQFELYAYCLMPNHIHLLIHSPVTSLGSVFRHVSTTYSSWFNAKYNRTGYLQEGRYFSEPVETEKYLFTVLRYIHQNPIKAGLETVPGETYPWNSFCDYISGINDIVNIEYILQLLGGLESFRSLHQIIVEEECLDINTLRKRLPDDVPRSCFVSARGWFLECESRLSCHLWRQGDNRYGALPLWYQLGLASWSPSIQDLSSYRRPCMAGHLA